MSSKVLVYGICQSKPAQCRAHTTETMFMYKCDICVSYKCGHCITIRLNGDLTVCLSCSDNTPAKCECCDSQRGEKLRYCGTCRKACCFYTALTSCFVRCKTCEVTLICKNCALMKKCKFCGFC